MDRPTISSYQDILAFIRDMLAFRKQRERSFSVLRASKALRRVSPALVSLILKGQRKVTSDRADELSHLLALTVTEKAYFRDWVARLNGEIASTPNTDIGPEKRRGGRRKAATSHILTDWINVYVKDAFQLKGVNRDPTNIYAVLAGIASQKRIDKAISFLLRAGYLRKDTSGQIVEDTPLHSVDQRIPDQKVRQFHKAALKTAMNALDQHTPSHRYANALILPLDDRSYFELTQLIAEFAERLQAFAESIEDGDSLYQVIIHLSPTGSIHE